MRLLDDLLTFGWEGEGDSWIGGLLSSRYWRQSGRGTLAQFAVLPAVAWVSGVAPGSTVTIWVPAQVPLQVTEEAEVKNKII